MNRSLVGALPLVLLLPTALAAQVVLRLGEPDALTEVEEAVSPGDGAFGVKRDPSRDLLAVPFYEVDTVNPGGNTTLYAVRNTSDSPVDLIIRYYSTRTVLLRRNEVVLDPRSTLTVNVRDVAGLGVPGERFTRGWIQIENAHPGPSVLVGDFFSVDVEGDFASGERLMAMDDLCRKQEIRFLSFGSGTELWLFLRTPRGGGPFSVAVTPVTEDGLALTVTYLYSSETVVKIEASRFTSEDSGTLIFDFSNSNGGYVFAKYSADGKFSVGLNPACVEP